MKDCLLFGNGFNRAAPESLPWDKLLLSLAGKPSGHKITIPYTFYYEEILLSNVEESAAVDPQELELKIEIANALEKQEPNELYDYAIALGFQNYLTLNYDYAFQKAIKANPMVLSTEQIYSVRRRRQFMVENKAVNLWHIHGEISHPKSIMLGLDHYCGSIGKLDAYVKGKYEYSVNSVRKQEPSIYNKLKSNTFTGSSWIELFFTSNVHLIGIGLDFSETDLWWLLDRRARMLNHSNISNRVRFYTSDKIKAPMESLLKAMSVEVVKEKLEGNNYLDLWTRLLTRVHES